MATLNFPVREQRSSLRKYLLTGMIALLATAALWPLLGRNASAFLPHWYCFLGDRPLIYSPPGIGPAHRIVVRGNLGDAGVDRAPRPPRHSLPLAVPGLRNVHHCLRRNPFHGSVNAVQAGVLAIGVREGNHGGGIAGHRDCASAGDAEHPGAGGSGVHLGRTPGKTGVGEPGTGEGGFRTAGTRPVEDQFRRPARGQPGHMGMADSGQSRDLVGNRRDHARTGAGLV